MPFAHTISRRAAFTLLFTLSLIPWSILGGARIAGAKESASPVPQAKPPAQAQEKLVPLPGHVLKILARAKEVVPAANVEAQSMVVTLVLHHTDEEAFKQLAEDVNNPSSPSYRHFLSQQQIAERFGPSQQAYDAVRNYLTGRSLTLVQGSANRLTLSVKGTRAQIESAFHVHIHDYQLGPRTFRANIDEPSLPESIAGFVQSVAGLSTIERPRPLFQEPDPNPMALSTAYDFSGVLLSDGQTVATGAGQTVGLIEFSGFQVSDVQNWLTLEGLNTTLATSQVTAVSVGTGPDPLAPQSEALLDIDTVLGAAPGAAIRVYEAPASDNADWPSWVAILSQMTNDPQTPTIISSSAFVGCEQDMEANSQQAGIIGIDAALMTAEMAGISVLTGSGDTQGNCTGEDGTTRTDVLVPADSPHVTAVGGTILSVSAGNMYGSETYWADTSGNGGGFGLSNFFAMPPWQAAFAPAGTTGRSVPDLSASAAPGIFLCEQIILGGTGGCPLTSSQLPPEGRDFGTSLSTPLWAAGIARINQACGPSGLVAEWASIGLQPGLQAFHPVSGMQGPNNDFSHLGFGSFDLGKLAAIRCVTGYLFSPIPVATEGTLVSSSPATVTLTAQNNISGTAVPVPNAPAYMQFTPTAGGGSVDLPMYNTLQTANTKGQIVFHYTAPQAAPPGGGADDISVSNSFGQYPFTSALIVPYVSASDTYTFPTLAYLCFLNSSGCSAQQSIFAGTAAEAASLGGTVPVTLQAQDANNNPAAGIAISLTFTPAPQLTGGSITAASPPGSANSMTTLTAGSAPFVTDKNGNVQITMAVPQGNSGLETITASATVPEGLYSIPLTAFDSFLVFVPGVPVLTASETRCGSSEVQAIVYGSNGKPMPNVTVLFVASGGTFFGAPSNSPNQIIGTTDAQGIVGVVVNAGSTSSTPNTVQVTASVQSPPGMTNSITVNVSASAARICNLQSEVLGHIDIGNLLAANITLLSHFHGPVPSCNLPGCPDPSPVLVWDYRDAVDPWLQAVKLTVEVEATSQVSELTGGIQFEVLSKSESTSLLRLRHSAQLSTVLPANAHQLKFSGAVARVVATSRAGAILGEDMIHAGRAVTQITLPLGPSAGSAQSSLKVVRLDPETNVWTDAGIRITHVDAHAVTAIVPVAGTYATIF
jgi:pro-kumamolisin-like protein